MIKVQDSTDFRASFDGGSGVGQPFVWFDELIPDPLMRSSVIVEVAVALGDVGESSITDEPDAMQAFLFERPEKAFDVRIAVRRAWWNADVGDARAGQYLVKPCLAKFAPAIMDQVRDAMLCEETSVDHAQVSCNLLHDDGIGIGSDQEHMHLAGCNDHGHADVEHFPASQRQHWDTREINTG